MKIFKSFNSVAIQSEYSVDTMREVAAYNPAALMLTDTNGEVVFQYLVGSTDTIDYNGIIWSRDYDGKATIMLEIPEGVEDVRQYVKDNYFRTLNLARDVEGQISSAAAQIVDKKGALNQMFMF